MPSIHKDTPNCTKMHTTSQLCTTIHNDAHKFYCFRQAPQRGLGRSYVPEFWGGHGPWTPMGARVPRLSSNDDPNPSWSQQKAFGRNQKKKIKCHKTACKLQFWGFRGALGLATWA